jgi:hypothetical protein
MSIPSFWDRESLWLFVLFVSLYSLTMSGHLYTADGVLTYETTRSLAERGSLELPRPGFLTLENTKGKPVSRYSWGQPILLMPFYWLGVIAGHLFADGASGKEAWCLGSVIFSSVVVGGLLVLATRYLSRVLGADERAALFVAFAAGCGSILWVYSQDLFRNPLAALLLTTATASLFGVHKRPRLVHLSGAAFLLLVQVRMDGLLALPILLGWLVWAGRNRAWIHRRAAIIPWVLWSIGGLLLVGLNNLVRFGNPFRIPYNFYTESLLISIPGFIWSSDKSMFLYSPPLLLVLSAIPMVWRWRKSETVVILALALVYLVSYGKYHHWFGGRCWGPRYTIQFTPLLLATVGPWLLEKGRPIRARWVIGWCAIGIGVLVQLTGLLIEQNVHMGLHHLRGITMDLMAGQLDPWWARTWSSHRILTVFGIIGLAGLCGVSAFGLMHCMQQRRGTCRG